jgi:hypothetical protein
MDKVIGSLASHRAAAADEVVRHIEQYFKRNDFEVITDEVVEYLSIQPVTLLMEGQVIFESGFPKSASWKARLTLDNDQLRFARLSISDGEQFDSLSE